MIINSFLAITKLGCADFSSLEFDGQQLKDQRIQTKYFLQVTGKYRLNKRLLQSELLRNLYTEESKLESDERFLNRDYVDKQLVKLVQFLSKYVSVECLQTATMEQLIEAGAMMNGRYQTYYDFDFIDQDAYLNYKLFNKLKLNPNVSLLFGGLAIDRDGGEERRLMDKYPTGRFNAPLISKEETIEIIKSSGILSTGIIDPPVSLIVSIRDSLTFNL